MTLHFGKPNLLRAFPYLIASLAIFFAFFKAVDLWNRSPILVQQMNLLNERSGDWFNSGKCAQSKRILFVFCAQDGSVLPIEDRSLADDRGHTLFINFFGFIKKDPVEFYDLIRINILINFFGILLLAACLWFLNYQWVGLTFLIGGSAYGLLQPKIATDVISGSLGTFCWALSGLLLINFFAVPAKSKKLFWIFTLMGFLAFSIAALVRQSLAIGPFVVCIAILIISFLIKWNSNRRMERLICVLVAYFAVMILPGHILKLRSLVWDIPISSARIATHGFSHTLYLGLGTEPNPWGIKWDDSIGEGTIRGVDPSAGYVSEEYYGHMRALYIQKVIGEPWEVSKIYFQKALVTVKTIYHENWWIFGLHILFFTMGIGAIALRKKSALMVVEGLHLISIYLPLIFVLLIGVLANPHFPMYLEFGTFIFALAFLFSIDVFYKAILKS